MTHSIHVGFIVVPNYLSALKLFLNFVSAVMLLPDKPEKINLPTSNNHLHRTLSLTNAAGSAGDFHALRDTLNKRIQDNCFNTKSTFDFVIDETFSSSLLNSLLQTLSTLNRGVTHKNAFDSLITHLCKFQCVDDALHAIKYMARTDAGGCRPSATTFYPVLNILSRQEAIGHARRVVDFMSTLGVNLDLTGHNYFLVAHCYVGDVAAAAGVLKKMGGRWDWCGCAYV
ncbi:pentatricopeptide repeat-containing protein At3g56030, mitochondrial-like [Arachis stenosperma]|uniref:pentatricopeptide repeat-containing protein At3g56030, mitochondrial-like n=1 Tax=Arachis stenosperma TaxID=217475 RepID=UPI0025AC8639|nr:pentatricopeptide repeat-containing protein At3g56030, mitochondrial-like [Arachis stenosperma]